MERWMERRKVEGWENEMLEKDHEEEERWRDGGMEGWRDF